MIKILEEVHQDMSKAKLFYDKQNKQLGSYFITAIKTDIKSLEIYKGIHTKIDSFYRLLCKRFPYAIYYKLKDEVIYVYAVLDCRQHPTFIQKKLKGLDK